MKRLRRTFPFMAIAVFLVVSAWLDVYDMLSFKVWFACFITLGVVLVGALLATSTNTGD